MADKSDRVTKPVSAPAALAQRLIRIYQKLVSPALAKNCRYLPTCSHYAYEAVGRFGLGRGGLMAIRRVGRCHPFTDGGYDPVPEAE